MEQLEIDQMTNGFTVHKVWAGSATAIWPHPGDSTQSLPLIF